MVGSSGGLSGGAASRPSPSSGGVALIFTSAACCCLVSLPLGSGAFTHAFFSMFLLFSVNQHPKEERKAARPRGGETAVGRGGRGIEDHHSI